MLRIQRKSMKHKLNEVVIMIALVAKTPVDHGFFLHITCDIFKSKPNLHMQNKLKTVSQKDP